MAARVAGGRRLAVPARLVADAPGCPGRPVVAHRPPPRRAGGSPGRDRVGGAAPAAPPAAHGARRTGGHHAVHRPARGLQGAAAALLRAGGPHGRHTHRRTFARGAGAAHRPVRQHAGAAHVAGGQPLLPRVRHAREVLRVGGLRPSGRALREAGGGAPASASPGRLAVLPGDVRVAEHAPPSPPTARALAGRAVRRPGLRAVRAHPLRHGTARGAGPHRRVPHRALRRGHGGAAAGPPAHPAGGRRLPARRAPVGAVPAGRGGAPAGAACVERAFRSASARGAAAPVGGGPGGAHARRSGRHLRGHVPDVRAARCARQPARVAPARARCRAGGPRRAAPGAFAGAGGGVARHAEGRGRLCAVRPIVPGAAPGVDGQGRAARRVPGAGAAGRAIARPRRAGGPPGHAMGRGGAPALRDAAAGVLRGGPGLRHLHVGQHGASEGRDERASRHRQPAAVDAGCASAVARRRGVAEDALQLRRVRLGVLLAADDGGAAGGGAARGPSGAGISGGPHRPGAHHHHALRAVHAPGVPGGARPGALRVAAPGGVQRRSPPAGAGRAVPGAAAHHPAAQPLRPHRGRGGGHRA
ncbi:hypothetical protein COSO111634_20820 [Corallococcus soli]